MQAAVLHASSEFVVVLRVVYVCVFAGRQAWKEEGGKRTVDPVLVGVKMQITFSN